MIVSKLSSNQMITQNVKEKLSPSQMITSVLTSIQVISQHVQAYATIQPNDISVMIWIDDNITIVN
jgi:hypothetical protein